MKHLLLGAAALALLTGCNNTDKPAAAGDVELADVSVRTGNAANAADALAAMSLTDSATGVLSFASKDVSGATATFSDVSITGEDAVNVGSLVLEGLDMADGKASFGKMSLNDITISDDDMGDGEITLGNIELTNPSPELAAWLAGSLNGQQVDFPAAENIVFDSWSVSDLSGNFSDGSEEGTFGLGKIEIRDMTGTSAARAQISGFTLDVVSDETVRMNLDSMTMTNIDAKFVKAIQENAGDEDALLAAIMDAAYDNPMDPGYDAFAIDNLSISAAGASFAVPSLNASVERNAAGQPVKYTTEPFTMTLDADAEGGEVGEALTQGLSMLNYESLTLKGAGSATYDPDQDVVSYEAEDNYFELVDGAKFSFGGKIEGYSAYTKEIGTSFNIADMADGAEPDPEAMMSALGQLTFHNIEFSIDDDSLVNRAFNAAATAQGQDPEEMKTQISMGLAMAPMFVGETGVDVNLVTEATTALGSFLTEGGKLTFKLDPETPLAVADIMANPDPAAYTKESLGFTATQK